MATMAAIFRKFGAWVLQFIDFCRGVITDAIATFLAFPAWKKVAVVAAAVAAVVLLFMVDIPSVELLRLWADGAGDWFFLVYFLIYIVFTQFPIPRTFFTLMSGIFFGPMKGCLLALTATTVSATISFVIVRHFLRDWMAPKLTHPAVHGIDERLRQRGWLSVTCLRMIAGIPFFVLNYSTAVSSIRFVPYIAATFVGSAPNTIAIVLLGDTFTGNVNPALLLVSALLLVIGVSGLVLDAKLPVRGSGVVESTK